MNIALLNARTDHPSTRDLMERALDPHILLGMPHLTPFGLSETWLMKELGHRHWLMLARHLGMENADFRTADGREAYAAICATSLQDADFGIVRANDVLDIRSELSPVLRMQVSSRHRLSVRGCLLGEVELISTFVHRVREGDNHSIARIPLPGLQAPMQENVLARSAARLRSGEMTSHCGLVLTDSRPLRSSRFHPDAVEEFNGAGLFYFAEFQALTDRAFRSWFPEAPAISHREVFFFANVQPGEAIAADLMALSEDGTTSFCRLRRADASVIANVFTTRRGSVSRARKQWKTIPS